LDAHPELNLPDVGFSLATGRAALRYRMVVLAADRDAGPDDVETITGSAAPDALTAFLFSGQGAQRPGMGRDLYAAHPVFAGALEAACEHLDPGLRALMFAADGADVHRTEYTQPALFAFEVALFRLLESWGVRPAVVAGHSVG